MNLISFSANVKDANDEVFTVSTNTYDLFKAEQLLGKLSFMEQEVRLGDMYALIYFAAKRHGKAGDDFEAWLQEVEIELLGDADPKDD